MFDRLDQLEARYEELGQQLSDPNIVNNQENYRKVSKAHRDIEPTVEKFRQYRKLRDGVAEAKAMLTDADMKEMAELELAELEPKLAAVEEELKVMLLPKDPNDD
jgi:peptide chain release factor 1